MHAAAHLSAAVSQDTSPDVSYPQEFSFATAASQSPLVLVPPPVPPVFVLPPLPPVLVLLVQLS